MLHLVDNTRVGYYSHLFVWKSWKRSTPEVWSSEPVLLSSPQVGKFVLQWGRWTELCSCWKSVYLCLLLGLFGIWQNAPPVWGASFLLSMGENEKMILHDHKPHFLLVILRVIEIQDTHQISAALCRWPACSLKCNANFQNEKIYRFLWTVNYENITINYSCLVRMH